MKKPRYERRFCDDKFLGQVNRFDLLEDVERSCVIVRWGNDPSYDEMSFCKKNINKHDEDYFAIVKGRLAAAPKDLTFEIFLHASRPSTLFRAMSAPDAATSFGSGAAPSSRPRRARGLQGPLRPRSS